MVGEERDLLLGALAFGDVEDHPLDQPRFVVAVVDRERLFHHPLDRPVLVDHPVLVVQRDVGPVRVLVFLPDPIDVVLVDVPPPAVRILQPVRWRDPQEVGHLRADVDAFLVLVDGIQIDDARDLLDKRPVLRLSLEPSLPAGLRLRHVAERDDEVALDPLDRADVNLDGDRAAVAVVADRLDAGPGGLLARIRLDEPVDGPVDELVPREARQRLGVVVREHDPAVGVRHYQAFRGGLQQRAPRLDETG